MDGKYPILLKELRRIVRLQEGEPVWIEPAEAAAMVTALTPPDGYVLVPVKPSAAMLCRRLGRNARRSPGDPE